MEDELKEILSKLQKHSIKKFEDNKKFNQNGIAIFELKIIICFCNVNSEV